MNDTLTLPQGLLGSLRTDQPTIVAFPGKQAAKQLSGTTVEAVRSVSAIIDQIIIGAIEKRTAVDFIEVRNEVYPTYARVMLALGALANAVVPSAVMDRLTGEAFCEMEADLKEHGLAAFGAEVRDQAIFTVWTLRRINDVCDKIHKAPPLSIASDDDATFSRNYVAMALWTRFHLDSLMKSMQSGRPIYPDVMSEMINGLRSAVNAYAWARRGLDLRVSAVEPSITPVKWDEEDQELLAEASRDIVSSL